MSISFFWGSGSGPAWRVALALAVKGLPHDSKLLSFAKREHKSEEMLAMNPRGKVPVVRDGDYAVYESLAVLTYLDRKYPEVPLFGRTPEEAGRIMCTIMEHQCYGEPAISAVTRPILFGRLEVARDGVVAALPTMVEELEKLDAQAKNGWLVGDAISAADVFVYPALKTIERAFGKPGAAELEAGVVPIAGRFPHLGAWMARIEALPGYDATYPPHWREG